MPSEVVGEIEGGRLGFGHLFEEGRSREELIAVGAGHAGDVRRLALGGTGVELRTQVVERSSGTAVRVAQDDALITAPIALQACNAVANRACDERRPIVQLGGQAFHIDVVERVRADDGLQLVDERAARQHENPLGRGRRGSGTHAAARRARMRSVAVSAATAASRQ